MTLHQTPEINLVISLLLSSVHGSVWVMCCSTAAAQTLHFGWSENTWTHFGRKKNKIIKKQMFDFVFTYCSCHSLISSICEWSLVEMWLALTEQLGSGSRGLLSWWHRWGRTGPSGSSSRPELLPDSSHRSGSSLTRWSSSRRVWAPWCCQRRGLSLGQPVTRRASKSEPESPTELCGKSF